MRNDRWTHARRTGLIVALVVLGAGSAAAEPRGKRRGGAGAESSAARHADAAICRDAYAAGRSLERAGRLRDAKEQMLICAQPTCGSVRHGFLRHECLFRFARLQADIPSVIPVVTDKTGGAVVDAAVLVDGQPLTAQADGLAVAVDPGPHVFSTRVGGTMVSSPPTVILQGQQNRPIALSAAPKGTPAPAPPAHKAEVETEASEAKLPDNRKQIPERPATVARAVPPAAAVQDPDDEDDQDEEAARKPARREGLHVTFGSAALFTLAAAGGGGFGLLTYWGRKDNAALATCTPHCPQSSVDRVAKLYRYANIAGVAGGVALVGSVLLFATSGSSEPEGKYAHNGTRLILTPTPSGAAAWVSGTF